MPADATLAVGRGASMAFSPDGARLAFAAESRGKVQIYLHRVDGAGAAATVPGTEGGMEPFFSPDGQWLGFLAGEKLMKVPIAGGAPITVADAPTLRGKAWGDDGAIVLAPRDNTGLWRVSANGGTFEPVTALADGDASHRWPQVLPGGRGLVYTIWSGAWEPSQIAVQPAAGGPRRIVVTGGGSGRFVAGPSGDRGHLIYARPDGLMAVPFDLTRLEATGDAVRVAGEVITNFSGAAQFAVSASGVLAYASAGDDPERSLVWMDRAGAASPAATLRGLGRWYDLSADGSRIVRYKNRGGTRDVWIEDLGSGASTQLSHRGDPAGEGPIDRLNAVWSEDGRHVAYAAGAPLNLFHAAVGGGAGDARLTTSANTQWPGSWSPDGRTLAFVEIDPLSGSDLWLLSLDAAQKPIGVRPFLRTPFNESAPMISPDGAWLAYQSNESGRYEIYVQPFPGGGRRWAVSTDNGVYPRWSPRGDELFFRSGATRAGLAAATVVREPEFRTDPPRVLFEVRRYDSIFEVAPDASRFLMLPAAAEAAPRDLHLIVNWRGLLPPADPPTP